MKHIKPISKYLLAIFMMAVGASFVAVPTFVLDEWRIDLRKGIEND